ncbi:hypothetical protein TNCV_855971 [Trichonephila clavipes]|nr:hypothetical protein TNCV_855971 [Trichonephila clavipes]
MADVLLAPCHDEFRGPRSDYGRQVALATTTHSRTVRQKLKNLRFHGLKAKHYSSDYKASIVCALVQKLSLLNCEHKENVLWSEEFHLIIWRTDRRV